MIRWWCAERQLVASCHKGWKLIVKVMMLIMLIIKMMLMIKMIHITILMILPGSSQNDPARPSEAGEGEKPKEKSVQNHRHVFPVLHHLYFPLCISHVFSCISINPSLTTQTIKLLIKESHCIATKLYLCLSLKCHSLKC